MIMKKKRRSPSSSTSTELQLYTPKKTREPSSSASRSVDLAIVPSPNSSFTLPDDWIVEKRRRTSGLLRGTIDTYYHEPGTGRKLRSLISVKRYLTEPGRYEITGSGDIRPKMHQLDARPLSIALPTANYKPKPNVMRSSFKSRSLMKSLSYKSELAGWRTYIPRHQVNIDKSKPFKLPAGWFIRRITRAAGQSMGRVDKYYCERATGLVFRSKLDVLRYLADNYMEENSTLSELFKPAGLIQMSRSKDKDADEENANAIVPHSSNNDAYSSIPDDVPLKDLVGKSDDLPLKDRVRKSNGMPIKDLFRKSDDVPLKDLLRKSDDVPLKDLVWKPNDVPIEGLFGKSDDVPIKDLLKKSDDMPLDNHARKSDDMPLDNHARKSDDMPLNGHARKFDDVPLEDLVQGTGYVPLKDLVQETDDVPLKDLVRKSSVLRKTSKNFNKLSSPKKYDPSSATKTNTSSVDVPNQPVKIKWVLSGAGGDAWSPFVSDTIVAESLIKEWTQMFVDIVSQKHSDASISDAEG